MLSKTTEVAQAQQNKPANLATDNHSLAKLPTVPTIIQDESLRTLANDEIAAQGIHSQTALAKSVPFPFKPIISICVSLKNRSRMLHEGGLLENFPRTVRSFSDLAEVLGPIELVVADFHSDDWPLSQWLVSAGNLRVKIITVDGDFSRGRGLNVAASHASCDRLFLTDADVIVGVEAIKRGLNCIERGVVRFPIFRYLDIQNREQEFEDYSYGLTFLTRELAHKDVAECLNFSVGVGTITSSMTAWPRSLQLKENGTETFSISGILKHQNISITFVLANTTMRTMSNTLRNLSLQRSILSIRIG